jgi:hypothetical protein
MFNFSASFSLPTFVKNYDFSFTQVTLQISFFAVPQYLIPFFCKSLLVNDDSAKSFAARRPSTAVPKA